MNKKFCMAFATLIVCIAGCGSDPAPELTEDVASQIAAEDEQIVDAESEL